MKRNALTAKEVAGAKVGEHRDGAGLCLVVTSASKSWVHRYSANGKRSAVTIGKYPDLSLSAARVASEKIRENISKGIPAKALLSKVGEVTFADAIQLWLPVYSSKVEEKTKNDAIRRLELHAQDIMHMSIEKIKPKDVVSAMQVLVKKGQFETITKVTDNIKQVMEYVTVMGLIEFNSLTKLKHLFPQSQVMSFPALHPKDLPSVFTAMHNGTMTRQTKDLMVFQILSGLRCSEVVAAKWSGLHGDVITIEAEFMKGKRFKKRDHDVYLCKYAKEILERQPKKSEFIFPFRGDVSRHTNSETITKWLRENGFRGKLVAHGFRSMFSTWANSQKSLDGKSRLYDKDVIELCIAHKKENVQTIYDRNKYSDERMDVMIGWGYFVMSCWKQSLLSAGL